MEGNPIHRGAPERHATADGAEAHVLTLSEPVMHLGSVSALCHPRRGRAPLARGERAARRRNDAHLVQLGGLPRCARRSVLR